MGCQPLIEKDTLYGIVGHKAIAAADMEWHQHQLRLRAKRRRRGLLGQSPTYRQSERKSGVARNVPNRTDGPGWGRIITIETGSDSQASK
jgi:hypothetical protein